MKCSKAMREAFDHILVGMREKGKGPKVDLFSDNPDALGYSKIDKHHTSEMTPTDFLTSSARRDSGLYDHKEAQDFARNLKGRKVAKPILQVEVDGDKLRVVGHEGRHRSNLSLYLNGDQNIPVDIHVVGGNKDIAGKTIVTQNGVDTGRTLDDFKAGRNMPLSSDIDQNRKIIWEKRNNIKVGEGYGDHWVINDGAFDIPAYMLKKNDAHLIHGEQEAGMINPVKLQKLIGKKDTELLLTGHKPEKVNTELYNGNFDGEPKMSEKGTIGKGLYTKSSAEGVKRLGKDYTNISPIKGKMAIKKFKNTVDYTKAVADSVGGSGIKAYDKYNLLLKKLGYDAVELSTPGNGKMTVIINKEKI